MKKAYICPSSIIKDVEIKSFLLPASLEGINKSPHEERVDNMSGIFGEDGNGFQNPFDVIDDWGKSGDL